MTPGYSSRLGRRQPPFPGDDRIAPPVLAPTGVTQPSTAQPVLTCAFVPTEVTVQDYSSPSDNGSIRDTTAIDAFRAGASPSSGHVDIPVPAPTQGSLPTSTGPLTPALTDIQPTGPHCPEGNVDVSVHAQGEEVPSAAPTSRPPYRLDPVIAKMHIDRIPRFRVLVMGRANAGKTTILQRVCNATDLPEIFNGKGEKVDVTVVQGSQTRGYHNIEDELVFQSNPGFVFHDSCGFEAGSEEQFNMMRKFVMDRARTTKLNQRIHAIWFCIPLNETHRMVMTAEQKFFDHCDTGNVPVILLATKSDTLELEVFEQLEDKGISVDDADVAKLQEQILANHIAKLKAWLADTRFPPYDYLSLAGMQEQSAECAPLLTCTANALKEEGLQQLLISTQQSNLELCMEFAIMKVLKVHMKNQQHKVEPGPLAFYLSKWFPYVSNGLIRPIIC
ncbi:hypothetical protein EV401DRAFT_2068374 [Pisolithus croceorrhizus]|nr:hypothetical protein EV401DRAFT_2068374 [Pisolithus croceorrhizus]